MSPILKRRLSLTEVNFADFGGNAFDVVRQKVHVVADEIRRSCIARHNFGENFFVASIEKNIVTAAVPLEIIFDVINTDLQKIRQRVQISAAFDDDIQFAEADTRTI